MTNTVANTANISSLATKNSGSHAIMTTTFPRFSVLTISYGCFLRGSVLPDNISL